MNYRDGVTEYLQAVRRTLRWETIARGLGWTFAAALVLTCIAGRVARSAGRNISSLVRRR